MAARDQGLRDRHAGTAVTVKEWGNFSPMVNSVDEAIADYMVSRQKNPETPDVAVVKGMRDFIGEQYGWYSISGWSLEQLVDSRVFATIEVDESTHKVVIRMVKDLTDHR